jgi:hypothetical protein
MMRNFNANTGKKKKELPPKPDKPMSNSLPRTSLQKDKNNWIQQ